MKLNKIKILIIFIVISLASLACIAVSFEGFMCELTGGEWIRDDPISRQYYCVDQDSLTPPLLDENTNTEKSQVPNESPTKTESADIEIYEGTIILDDLYVQTYGPGSIIDNRINIKKDVDGALQGSLSYIFKGNRSQAIEWEESPGGPIHSCSSEISVVFAGMISGTLTVDTKTMQIELAQTQEINRFDCPTEFDRFDEKNVLEFPISLDGEKISGVIPGYFSFEAIKEP